MRRPLWSSVVLAALLLSGLTACADTEEEAVAEARKGTGWTVLHYSMGDTDLEPFMMEDVNEMGRAGAEDGYNLRAYVDRSTGYGNTKVLDQGSWTGARVLDIGAKSAELVEDLGEVNSANPEMLADFIAAGIKDRPAQKYALIISDHGASWPGLGPDESAENDVLTLAEVVKGISAGLEEAGLDRFDLLGFDACLMANYEVASAVAPLADRLVASQELEPGHGWDYTSLEVLTDPATTADELGQEILTGFSRQAKQEDTQESITLALLDLTAMDALDTAMDEFSAALARRAGTIGGTVGRAAANTLGFARSPDAEEDAHLKDLGLLASAIGTDALAVSDEADAVVKALNDIRIKQVVGRANRGASGLSLYFPPTAELADGAYRKVASAKPWAGFLSAYYEAGTELDEDEQAQFVDPENGAQIEFDEDGVSVTAEYTEAGQDNLVDATIAYALVEDDGSLTYLGEEFADIDPDGAPEAFGFYDLTTLVISDGEDEALAYLQLGRGEETENGDPTFTVDVPMAYYAPDDIDGETYQDVLLSLVLDEDGDVLSEIYYAYDPEAETYGELTADPEGIIVPEVLTVAEDGTEEWTATSDIGLFADLENLEYDLKPLESGSSLQLELSVTDLGDNTSTVTSVVEVP